MLPRRYRNSYLAFLALSAVCFISCSPAPILFRLAPHRRRVRVLEPEPVRDRPDRCASRGAWTRL